ncbi:hypothetical protein [Sphingosinicella sp.]|uniref:hypothetical protein n=1 Tax=Sphingosinicella sp. TaxID=1917971 RepID=UPI0040380BE9
MNALGSSTPVWFRLVGIVAVLWNLIGVWTYLGHVGAVPPMQPMTPEQQALSATVPAWVVGAFAIAVFSALLASVLMVMSRALARPLFLLSLVCVVAQMGWTLFVSNARAVEGNAAFVMPLVVTGIGALLYWASNVGVKRGWLR